MSSSHITAKNKLSINYLVGKMCTRISALGNFLCHFRRTEIDVYNNKTIVLK